MEVQLQGARKVFFKDRDGTALTNDIPNASPPSTDAGTKQAKFHSQQIPSSLAFDNAVATGKFPINPEPPPKNPRIDRLRDRRFDSFKTWSGKLERQLSNLRGKPGETEPEENTPNLEVETFPVDRFFDALEGPELDTLRVCVS